MPPSSHFIAARLSPKQSAQFQLYWAFFYAHGVRSRYLHASVQNYPVSAAIVYVRGRMYRCVSDLRGSFPTQTNLFSSDGDDIALQWMPNRFRQLSVAHDQ